MDKQQEQKNKEQLAKFLQIFGADKIVTPDDIKSVLKGVLEIMNSFKKGNETLNKETTSIVESLLNKVMVEHEKMKTEVARETSDTKEEINEKVEKSIQEMKKMCEDLILRKPQDGMDGKDADEEEIVIKVLEQIKLPENKVLTGEDIVDSINALSLDPENLIDASHIKNLPKATEVKGGGVRLLQYLADVNISNPTNNQVLKYNSTTYKWENGSGGAGTVDGSGTTDELAYWVDSDTLGALAVATYPSKTEISYVKGVTSAIQTQLNAKQPLDTQLTSLAGLSYTGNGGKFIRVNAGETDFELATVSGSGDVSKVGTPVDNQIGVWTGDGTIEGDVDFTFDTTSNTLTLAGVAGTSIYAQGGANILVDSPRGTMTLSNIDAIDATTEATIEAAIDTLANLTSIQGRTVTLADAGANAIFGWDDTAGAYENLTQAEARTVLGLGTAAYVATDLADLNEATIEAAIDTLSNLTSIQGQTFTLAGAFITSGANSLTLTTTGATNVTLPTTGTLATLAGSETLSNKTLTAPKFADLGFIADANGNELLIMDTVTSAVNEITLKNAATTTNPGLTATGGDTNVGIDVTTKGTGTFNLRGNATQPGELRLYEDTDLGTNYTAFKVGTQAADVSYVLPTAQGGASTVLQNDGSGNLSWTTVGGGFDPFAGNFIVVDWSASSWSEFGSGGAISYRKASADFTSDGGGTSSRFAYVGSVSGNPLQALVTTGKVTTIQMAILNISELSANHTIYFRVENAGSETANPPSSTVRYYGFSINNGNITCGNANGTTATTTAAGTVTATETLSVLKMVITYGTDVKFYKNGTLLATHTTNLPSATTYRIMTGFVNSDTTSRGYDVGQMTMFSAY